MENGSGEGKWEDEVGKEMEVGIQKARLEAEVQSKKWDGQWRGQVGS